MIRGQPNRWYPPAQQRAGAELRREATAILADDRRQRHTAEPAVLPSGPSIPSVPSKWIKLADLKRALRNRERAPQ
jgi:hypothetical protein